MATIIAFAQRKGGSGKTTSAFNIAGALGQRLQRFDVGHHEPRLMKAADQILAARGIDSGFSADGAIDLRDDGCGNLHVRDAAEVNRRDETGEVAHDAAA